MRARLVFAHQPAETGYIRMQNGGEFPLSEREFPPEDEAGYRAGWASRMRLTSPQTMRTILNFKAR